MARYYFDNDRTEELAFADLLDRLSRDIRSGNVRLIGADHLVDVTALFDQETISIHFHRHCPSQENN